MIVNEYKHGDLFVTIVIFNNLIILSSRFSTLRLRLSAPMTDEDALKWLRPPETNIATWRRYALERAEPEVKNVFNDDAWGAFCESIGIDSGKSYEARDIAREAGYRLWIEYLESELFSDKLQAVNERLGEFWGFPQDEANLIDAARAWAKTYAPATLDIQAVAQAVAQAQDASNLSGLVLSWAKWMPVINAHARAQGLAQNLHPVNKVMTEKISQLAGLTSVGQISDAYRAVDKLAGPL